MKDLLLGKDVEGTLTESCRTFSTTPHQPGRAEVVLGQQPRGSAQRLGPRCRRRGRLKLPVPPCLPRPRSEARGVPGSPGRRLRAEAQRSPGRLQRKPMPTILRSRKHLHEIKILPVGCLRCASYDPTQIRETDTRGPIIALYCATAVQMPRQPRAVQKPKHLVER